MRGGGVMSWLDLICGRLRDPSAKKVADSAAQSNEIWVETYLGGTSVLSMCGTTGSTGTCDSAGTSPAALIKTEQERIRNEELHPLAMTVLDLRRTARKARNARPGADRERARLEVEEAVQQVVDDVMKPE